MSVEVNVSALGLMTFRMWSRCCVFYFVVILFRQTL